MNTDKQVLDSQYVDFIERWRTLPTLTLVIDQKWDGTTLPTSQHGSVRLTPIQQGLKIEIMAYFNNDIPPSTPIQTTWKLWEYEVVECFITNGDKRYIELEFGPYGHHLGLRLSDIRSIDGDPFPIELTTQIDRKYRRWSGSALLSWHDLFWLGEVSTERICVNAFACWGPPHHRIYAVNTSLGDGPPDFHRVNLFSSWITLAKLRNK